MKYALIAVPVFDADAAQRVGAIRAAHDPLHASVAPHVTLVYPTDTPALETARAAVQAFVQAAAPFDGTFDRLGVAADPYSRTHPHLVYLLPDAATQARLVAFRAALALPLQGDEVPHVTVARFAAAADAVALVRAQGNGTPAQARFASLDLLRLEDGAIALDSRFALSGAA